MNTSGSYGGKNATVLELTPKQASAQYKKLLFVVDPSDWHVTESIAIDPSGNINDFRFYAPDLTSTVDAGWYGVDPASMPTYQVALHP